MPAKAKRKRMLEFSIGEISGVDAPAQEHATVDIMLAQDLSKGKLVVATDVVAGHQHAIKISEVYRGANKVLSVRVIAAIAEGGSGAHGHEIYRDSVSGKWVITSEGGHSHQIDGKPIDAEIARIGNANYPDVMKETNMTSNLELALAAQLSTGAYDHLGGPEIRKNVLRPIMQIADQKARDGALAAIRKSGPPPANANGKLTGWQGQIALALETPAGDTAEAELEKLAEARADKMGISYQRAYDFVLRSGRGKELAAAMQSHNRGTVDLATHFHDMMRDKEIVKSIAKKAA